MFSQHDSAAKFSFSFPLALNKKYRVLLHCRVKHCKGNMRKETDPIWQRLSPLAISVSLHKLGLLLTKTFLDCGGKQTEFDGTQCLAYFALWLKTGEKHCWDTRAQGGLWLVIVRMRGKGLREHGGKTLRSYLWLPLVSLVWDKVSISIAY